MKKIRLIQFASMIIALTIPFAVTNAGAYPYIEVDDLIKVSPVYVLVLAQTNNCLNFSESEQCKIALKNNDITTKKVRFVGTIDTIDGDSIKPKTGNPYRFFSPATISVAKDLVVAPEDKLTNSLEDTGKDTQTLEFDFETEFYKGFILKVYFPESIKYFSDSHMYLNYDLKIGDEQFNVDIPWKNLRPGNTFTVGNMENSEGIVRSIVLPYSNVSSTYYEYEQNESDANLNLRNAEFKKRLNIGSKLLGVERWARGKYLNGEIDANLLVAVMELSKSAWTKSYSDEFTTRFNRRFSQLKFMLDREMISPLRLYGALNTLMKGNR